MNTHMRDFYGGLLHAEFGFDDDQKHQQVGRETLLHL